MSKKTIRVKWGEYANNGDPIEESFEYRTLSKHFDLEITDKPDYLFCNIIKHDDLKYNGCVKIARTGENVVPDFNRYDYAIGFDYITFNDRYLRVPLYVEYQAYKDLEHILDNPPSSGELLNRKFCSFVVSNAGADPLRDYFFKELSKYKKVDSGGRHLNNIGGPVADKLEFCRQYKFNIAVENSVSPGYTTEKVMQPLTVHSVPIYYGDPLVNNDFTSECMVRIRNKDDVARAIEEVIALDKNDDAYLQKCLAKPLVREWDYFHKQREQWLLNIFSQPLETARRTVDFGYQRAMRSKLWQLYRQDAILKAPLRKVRSIFSMR